MPSNLVLTQLWLSLAALWFCWRLWADVRRWIGGLIDLALLLIASLMFTSAALAAPYKHPAWLIAWEWLGYLAAFSVIRQLAVTDRDRIGLFSALLASGVMVALAGVVQWLVELPARSAGSTATFSAPSSLVSFLLLVVPGLVGAAIMTRRHRAWGRLWFVGTATFVVLLGLASCRPDQGVAPRLLETAWKRTATMLEGSVWLGVGPGNFGREYPHYLQPGDGEPLREAPNLFLDLAASAGIVAPLLLLAIMGLFLVAVRRRPVAAPGTKEPAPTSPAPAPADEKSPPEEPLPWEFYFGGMFGLLLGMLLRLMGPQSELDIWHEGLQALVRSGVWFIAFAILEGVPWSPRVITRALAAGILLMLLHLLIVPGIGYSSLAIPMWVMMALALNSVSIAPNRLISPRRVGLALAVPVAVCVPLLYLLAVLSPITSSAGYYNLAYSNGQQFRADLARKPEERKNLAPPLQHIRLAILRPLEVAARDDPGNARIPLMLAQWNRQMWFYLPFDEMRGGKGLNYVAQAQQLDPHGQEAFLVEAQLRRLFASRLAPWNTGSMSMGLPFDIWLSEFKNVKRVKEMGKESLTQSGLAAKAFTELAALDPTAPLWHYQAAESRCLAGDQPRMVEEARKALDLDEQTKSPSRRLTDPQREQIRHWLATAGNR